MVMNRINSGMFEMMAVLLRRLSKRMDIYPEAFELVSIDAL